MKKGRDEFKREAFMIAMIIVAALFTIPEALSANDPGHDTLYVEQTGDSEITGSFNVSYNTSFKGGFAALASFLDIYANGFTVTSPSRNTIAGTGDLYIDSPGNVYINSKSGDGTVFFGDGDTVDVSVSRNLTVFGDISIYGQAYIGGTKICVSNGSNCPSTTSGANVTSVATAGYLPQMQSSTVLNNSVIYQNSSNIGIGTTTPTQKLDVNGSVNISLAGSILYVKNILINGSAPTMGGGSGSGNINGTGIANYLAMWNGTSTQNYSVIYQNSSNIGIGTTTPTQKLDVNGSINISDPGGMIYTPTLCISGTCMISWAALADSHNHTTSTIRTGTYAINISGTAAIASDLTCTDCIGATEISDSYLLNNGDAATGDYSFDTNTLVVDSTYHMVGIGTTNPSLTGTLNSKLTVNGYDGNLSIVIVNSTNPRFGLNISSTGGWTLQDYGTGSWSKGITQQNGSVGIGTTAPEYLLHITSTSPWIQFEDTSPAQKWRLGSTLGFLYFYDQTNTRTSMVIANSTGYVGIGTTTPNATLEVAGGIRMNTTATKPTCDATIRGTMWYYQAGASTNDTLYTCMKNSADAYNWVVVAIG